MTTRLAGMVAVTLLVIRRNTDEGVNDAPLKTRGACVWNWIV